MSLRGKPEAIVLLAFVVTAATAAASPQLTPAQTPTDAPGPTSKHLAEYGKLPLSFEANHGQTDPSVKFLSRGSGYSLYFTDSASVLSLSNSPSSVKTCHPERSEGPASPAKLAPQTAPCAPGLVKGHDFSRAAKAPASTQPETIQMRLANANPAARIEGADQLPGVSNYFVGNDPAKWRTNVPTYAKVKYSAVYPGIDLVYYGNQSQLEYDFVVAPNANPSQIQLNFTGQKAIKLAPNGDLILKSTTGQTTLHKPIVYQRKDGQRQPIQGSFELAANRTVRFHLGNYDRTQPLVIDPILSYSTYLDTSSSATSVAAITVDAQGEAYVTGNTKDVNFPVTTGAFQSHINNDGGTAFISKLNAEGTALIYSTFLGGDSYSIGESIAVDGNGSAYIAGYNNSSDFPVTSGAFQTNGFYAYAGVCFVAKLNPLGSALDYATFLGGATGPNFCNSIKIDTSGDAFVAGSTVATDFPTTPGAFQLTNNEGAGATGFISKLNPTGSKLLYSTYLGDSDVVTGIALDSHGDVFATASTDSTSFPTTGGAYQTKGTGVFATELNPSGTGLVYSTLLGNSPAGPYDAVGIAVDSAGNAYVAGSSQGETAGYNPSESALPCNAQHNFSGFVIKINPAGTALVYSTLLCGAQNTLADVEINGLAIDSEGNAYVVGETDSASFPVTAGAVQINDAQYLPGYTPLNPFFTTFMTELNATGSSILYSTYLGGAGFVPPSGPVSEEAQAVALDGSGGVYVAGYTAAQNFPTSTGAFETGPAAPSGIKGFIARLALGSLASGAATTTTLSASPQAAVPLSGLPVALTAKVASVGSNAIPTGTVAFTQNGTLLAKQPLDATGTAHFSPSNLPVGENIVTANYGGSAASNFSVGVTNFAVQQLAFNGISGRASGTYGTPFATPIKVQALANSTPVAGVPVAFTGSGLDFSPASAITDANGYAQTVATPARLGNFTASASVGGSVPPVPPISFDLSAGKAILHIGASSVASTYGKTPPQPTAYHFTGFLLGDTASVVSGAPVLTSTVTATTPAGNYPIGVRVGTLAATNYSFSTTSSAEGVVEVAKAPLTILPASVTIHAGDPLPTFAYSITGFVNGDTQATATTGAPSIATTATSTNTPGRYYIVAKAGTLAAQNYNFSQPTTATEGILTILPK